MCQVGGYNTDNYFPLPQCNLYICCKHLQEENSKFSLTEIEPTLTSMCHKWMPCFNNSEELSLCLYYRLIMWQSSLK
jgi:hypothetical protein